MYIYIYITYYIYSQQYVTKNSYCSYCCSLLDASAASKPEQPVGAGESTEFVDASGAITSGGGSSSTGQQSLSWRAHQVDSWYEMCDATLQDM